MYRVPNTNTRGNAFSELEIQRVWNKAPTAGGYDPAEVRFDSCGAFIRRDQYGNTNSQFGWEIDHMFPASKGGSDELTNLQPLQWQNNRHKGDQWPYWSCAVKAA